MKTKHAPIPASTLTYAQKAKIAQLVEDGQRLVDLTHRYGISHTTLRRIHEAFQALPEPHISPAQRRRL